MLFLHPQGVAGVSTGRIVARTVNTNYHRPACCDFVSGIIKPRDLPPFLIRVSGAALSGIQKEVLPETLDLTLIQLGG